MIRHVFTQYIYYIFLFINCDVRCLDVDKKLLTLKNEFRRLIYIINDRGILKPAAQVISDLTFIDKAGYLCAVFEALAKANIKILIHFGCEK